MDDEDLSTSHWGDVISPNSQSIFGNLGASGSIGVSGILPPADELANGFNEFNINDHRYDQDNKSEDGDRSYGNEEMGESNQFGNNYSNQAEQEQLNELRKEEREEHKNNLLSELTSGADGDDSLLASSSIVTPKKVNPNESLFNIKDSPIKYDPTTAPKHQSNNNKTTGSKNSHTYRNNPRVRKFPSKTVLKHLDGRKSVPEEETTSNPLGPLGGSDDSKSIDHSIKSNNRADLLVQEANSPLYEIPKDNENKELPAPSQEAIETRQARTEPEDPDANKLVISVGDPMKVGDLTNAHIVYNLKVKNNNTSPNSHPVTPEPKVVTRRYKDFRWIYHQLQNNHPGRIIPPPPTKQTYIGRFNENFIENRRLSLEKMLNKISSVEVLSNDPDFVMFLTSDDFVNESRERERQSGSGASTQNNEFLDNSSGDGNGDGVDSSSVNSSSTLSAPILGGNRGFMTSLFSMSNKIAEPDEYFSEKKQYIEDLESNLKSFYRAIESIGTQRYELVAILDELSLALDELAALEISKVSSDLLSAFSEVQLKLKENLDRINLQDQLTLGFTIEEYLRIIGSIKFVFETRSKIYQQYHTFNQDLIKKSAQLDKQTKKYKMQVEKNNLLAFEVDKLKQKTQLYEKNFNNISETIKSELANFEFGRIEDFRNSVEIFIESSIESQKEAIELYETFYERQNLAEV